MPSKIEWTDETWNPVTGCTKVSEGCRNCYAERMAKRLAGRCGYLEQPHHFDVTLHPDKLDLPLRWKRPRMVFVCSMGDLFHEDVRPEFAHQVFEIMEQAQQHTFQVLTKRPDKMNWFISVYRDWRHWPLPNIWLGISAENQTAADERIPLLLQTPAAVRFVSCEPLLGMVDLGFGPDSNCIWCNGVGEWNSAQSGAGEWIDCQCITKNKHLNWLICGGESGPGARPMHPDWARSLRDQCQRARVPFFFKQWGYYKEIQFDKRGKGDVLVSPTRGVIDHLPDPWEYPEEFKHTVAMSPVGKRDAGRVLDGRTWDEMPER